MLVPARGAGSYGMGAGADGASGWPLRQAQCRLIKFWRAFGGRMKYKDVKSVTIAEIIGE